MMITLKYCASITIECVSHIEKCLLQINHNVYYILRKIVIELGVVPIHPT